MDPYLIHYLSSLEDEAGFNGEEIGPHTRSRTGDTPLHIAAIQGDLRAIELLLAEGADIDARGEAGMTSLHHAVQMDRPEAAALLLDRGADPHLRNDHEESPLETARLLKNAKMQDLLLAHPHPANGIHRNSGDIARFLERARSSFTLMRWMAVAGFVGLPFTFGDGPMPLRLMIGAVLVAGIWLGSMMLAWRQRRNGWLIPAFATLFFGPRLFGITDPEVSGPESFQWLCALLILGGGPMLFLPARMMRLARLDPAEGKNGRS